MGRVLNRNASFRTRFALEMPVEELERTEPGPVVPVGFLLGVVITEAGTHDMVAGLVHMAALAPDKAGSATH